MESYLSDVEIAPGVWTRGNPDAFQGTAIVAFIDLLGFSASIRRHWNDANNPPLEKLLRIKNTAASSRKTTIIISDTATAPPLPKEAYRSRIHTISDSIVVCSALPPDLPGNVFLRSLWTVFASVQFIWESAATEGYAIRGAIELGDIYWTPAETIGPAFLGAYYLESKVSQCSRVIIGPELLKAAVQWTDGQLNQLGRALAVCPDKLIELAPSRLLLGDDTRAKNLLRFENMQNACETEKAKQKYQYLLSLLRDASKVKWVSHNDLQSGIEQLLAHCDQGIPSAVT
ncbi:MAG TPA: hypothetical protein VIF02_09675 [Methylocella sp.]|jgi:hypothetical protein